MVSGFDLVDIEVEQQLAGLDLIALSNLRIEAVAVHGNCVDADVDQKFHIMVAGNTDRVLCIGRGGDLAVEGCVNNAELRLDAYALAENACREGLVGNVGGRNDVALDGSVDLALFAGDLGERGSFLDRRNLLVLGLILVEEPGNGEGSISERISLFGH